MIFFTYLYEADALYSYSRCHVSIVLFQTTALYLYDAVMLYPFNQFVKIPDRHDSNFTMNCINRKVQSLSVSIQQLGTL